MIEQPVVVADAGATEPSTGDGGDDDLMKAMMGAGTDAGAAAEAGGTDDLFAQMMGAGVDAGADAAKEAGPAAKKGSDEDLFNQMMNGGH